MTHETASPAPRPLAEPERERLYLHPGQLTASLAPAAVTTILGSCVAVCLWDPKLRAGGMNHFVLPLSPGGPRNPRFCKAAIELLLERMASLGCRPSRIQAKIFGGANRLEMKSAGVAGLGQQNVDAARALLAELKIPILAQDVGGTAARKLIFQTDDGVCLLKRM